MKFVFSQREMDGLFATCCQGHALEAFQLLSKLEGIIPALEPSHALAHVMRVAPKIGKDHIIVVTLSGRGDKDVFTAAHALGATI